MKKSAIITLRCGAEQKQKIEKRAQQQGNQPQSISWTKHSMLQKGT